MLEFSDVSKRYGEVVALDGCSFTVAPGRLTGFLGPNGAGKTTAMRAVFGLVAADRGIISWRGSPVGAADRPRFGYMPEERGLYPRMHVRDQLIYLGRLSGLTPRQAAAAADRWLPRLGLEGRATSRVDALSHGNQQRVQLAAALIADPELLLLDEPFSGLDPLAMDAMASLLREAAAAGSSVLFSSHQLDLVEHLCDDVVVIDRGRVVLAGDLEDLRAADPERFLEVTYRGGAPVPIDRPGIEVLAAREGYLRLRLDKSIDLPAILAGLPTGHQVLELRYQPPSLTDLFHRAVAA